MTKDFCNYKFAKVNKKRRKVFEDKPLLQVAKYSQMHW